MTFDERDVAFEWAWTKGWKVELTGTTVTVRDGRDYVMTEMDFCHVRPDVLRMGINDLELQKSAIHAAVLLCGKFTNAARWWHRQVTPEEPAANVTR